MPFFRFFVLSCFGLLFSGGSLVFAAMSSTNYQIQWDSFSSGSSDTSSSTSYKLRDSLGSGDLGNNTSTSYQIDSGYRAGIYDQVVALQVFGQSSTSTSATSLSGTQISVSSTSSFSAGDYIALVQDEGVSQVAAVGKISSIGVGTLTVDFFKNGGTAPTIDGTNDKVYKLSGTAVALGTLSWESVTTSIVGFEVSADTGNGYTVSVLSDGALRYGVYDINDVTDGSVTAGAEEYGGRSTDTTLANSTFDTVDTAFSTTAQEVATESAAAFDNRNFVTLKASMNHSSSTNGSYSQALSFVLSGNF